MSVDNNFGQPEDKEKKPVEIERRFLITRLPDDLDKYLHDDLEQDYLSIGEDGSEDRVRRKGSKFIRTQKQGLGLERTEQEAEITEEEYEALKKNTVGRPIKKTRYYIPHGGQVIELSIFHDQLEGITTAEVEFDTKEEAEAFIPPDWFDAEVTEDGRFAGQSLALHGIPGEKDDNTITPQVFETEEGLARLMEIITEKMDSSDQPVIVEIAGGSASGKTSRVAEAVKQKFGTAAVMVTMDDYYRGATYMKGQAEQGVNLNWDQPEAVDIPLVREHLAQLKAGQPIQKPAYDFKTGTRVGSETVEPGRVVIVEGLFALNDEISSLGDVRVFVDIGPHGRIIRRLMRDVNRTGQKPQDILKYFAEVVEPMHEKYIQSTKGNADIVIRNEYNPSIEAQRAGTHEVQLKFHGTIDSEVLRKVHAEKLSTTVQADHYYNPRDRNLTETEELLRIRDENGAKLLSYKGPKTESPFRKRPKFEFTIDQETESSFLAMYGDQIKVIKKERTLYSVDGVVFSLDEVSVIEGDEERQLGQFVEIRSVDEGSEGRVTAVIEKLGLNITDGFKDSYIEMANRLGQK